MTSYRNADKGTSVSKRKIFGSQFWLIIGALVIVVLTYIPLFQNSFLNWDDNRYITQNPFIRNLSWSQVLGYFTMFFDGHYHPLTLLSLAIDYRLGNGAEYTFQATNLILHLVNTLLVYIISERLFCKRVISFIVMLLFALSPIQVESVAWMSERKNLLFATFFFLALLSYLRYVEFKSIKLYFLTLVFFLLAGLSKATSITFIAVVIIVDIFTNQELFSKRSLVEKTPFILLSVFLIIIGARAQDIAWSQMSTLPFSERLPYASFSFVMYFIKAIVPFNLSGFYPYPDFLIIYWAFLPVALTVGLLALLLINKHKEYFFGLAFFVVNIVVMLKLFKYPYGHYFMADRYNYIPSVGVYLLVAFCFYYLIKRFPKYKTYAVILVFSYILVLAILTNQRVRVWNNNYSFFEDIVLKYPKTEIAWNNLGNAKLNHGDLNGALQCFNNSLKIDSTNINSLNNIANIKAKLNDYTGAIQMFDKVIRLNPSDSMVYYNRGLSKMGIMDWEGSISDFNTVIKQHKNFADVYCNRGVAYANLKDFKHAISSFSDAIKYNPKYSIAYFNRGNCYAIGGQYSSALNDFSESIVLNPDYLSAYIARAKVYLMLNEYIKATEDLKRALLLDPNNLNTKKLLFEAKIKS